MSGLGTKGAATTEASVTSSDPPKQSLEPASSSESSTNANDSAASVEASSSSSANITGDSTASGVTKEKPKSNAAPNNDPNDISNLTPILQPDLIANSHENQANDDAKVRASSYVVSLLSGDELFINKKDLLVAALEEHVEDKKTEQKRLEEDAEKIKGETSKIEKEFLTAHEVFRVADESARQAIEAREKALEKLSTAIEKRVSARAKQRDAAQVLSEAEANYAVVQSQVDTAAEAGSAEVARGFLVKIQEDEQDECDGGRVSEGMKEKDGSDSNPNPSSDVSRATNASAKSEQGSEAGKKRGREEDLGLVDDDGSGDGTPPRKAAKWDETKNENAGSLGTIETDEVFGGVVFNSPVPASPSNLNFFSRSPCDKSSTENRIDHDSSQNSAIRFSSKLVREFALKAINVHRESTQDTSLTNDPCQLLQQIFCVHRSSGEVFEGDAVTVPESVLIRGDASVGIRDYKELELRAIMKPFHVLSNLLQQLEGDVVETDGVGGGDGATDGGDNNAIGTASKTISTGIQDKWWNVNGYPATMSERDALIKVARHLCTAGRDPESREDARLSRSFFRYHWPQFRAGQSQNGGGVDVEFARTSFTRNGDDPANPELEWPFPSCEAWMVGMFQLGTDELTDSSLLSRIFPKFTLSLLAACLVLALPPRGPRATLDFHKDVGHGLPRARQIHYFNGIGRSVAYALYQMSQLAVTAPELLPGPWSWVSPSSHEKLAPWHYKFKLPLVSVISRFADEWRARGTGGWRPGCKLAMVLEEMLKSARDSAAKPMASQAVKDEYWNLKQGIVGEPCEDEHEWQRKLLQMEMRWQAEVTRNQNRPHGDPAAEALLLIAQQTKRVDGVGKRPEKSYKLGKETVLQLDI